MIIGWIRLWLMGAVALTVVYFLVSIYSRSVRRERLEKKFDAGGVAGDRSTYISAGMAAYESGLRKRLLWLIYILPTVAFVATIYILNFQ